MRRVLALLAALAVVLTGIGLRAPVARAALREATIGNYYYEDDVVGDRKRLVADQGDQIRFTVRETDYPPHSVNVDELGIESPDLLLFDTYTTPPLDRPGTYRLYCRPHQDRGHVTTLVVRARSASTTASSTATSTTSAGGGATSSVPPVDGDTTTTAAGAAVTTTQPATTDGGSSPTVPSGLGKATDRRRAPPAPDSLAGILGRQPAAEAPWTRALRLGAAAAAAMLLVVVASLAAGRRREDRVGR